MGADKPLKTHCEHGHEFTEANVYRHPAGYRVCKLCRLAHQKHYIETHIEWRRASRRKWAQTNAERLKKDPQFIARRRRDANSFRERHPERVKAGQRYQYWKIRNQVFVLYGGRCAKCGFADERALQLDNVLGGGAKEKKRIGSLGIYKQAIAQPDRSQYQLLCANCNWIKAYESYEKERIYATN